MIKHVSDQSAFSYMQGDLSNVTSVVSDRCGSADVLLRLCGAGWMGVSRGRQCTDAAGSGGNQQ